MLKATAFQLFMFLLCSHSGAGNLSQVVAVFVHTYFNLKPCGKGKYKRYQKTRNKRKYFLTMNSEMVSCRLFSHLKAEIKIVQMFRLHRGLYKWKKSFANMLQRWHYYYWICENCCSVKVKWQQEHGCMRGNYSEINTPEVCWEDKMNW